MGTPYITEPPLQTEEQTHTHTHMRYPELPLECFLVQCDQTMNACTDEFTHFLKIVMDIEHIISNYYSHTSTELIPHSSVKVFTVS